VLSGEFSPPAVFRDFGKFTGVISDAMAEASCSSSRAGDDAGDAGEAREQAHLAGKEAKTPSIPELRKDARTIPPSPHSTLTLADGTTGACFIIDLSVAGAAVSAQLQPPIGTPPAVGACVGRVVRIRSDGFAVRFVERQIAHDLARLLARPVPPKGQCEG
jgi:hypothetical protein